jgi:hypothetical protein
MKSRKRWWLKSKLKKRWKPTKKKKMKNKR